MAVLLTTFFLTVIFDLTIAIEIGLLIAMVLFMKRVAETTRITVNKDVLNLSSGGEVAYPDEVLTIPKGVEVYEIEGPFFFGIANKFDEIMKIVGKKPKVRVIRMRSVPFIDSTGLHNLESLYRLSKGEGIRLVLSGVNNLVLESLERSGLATVIGKENIRSNINEALERSWELLAKKE